MEHLTLDRHIGDCPRCGRALDDVAVHTFLFRRHWPDRIVSEVYYRCCARCCQHRPRKPKGQPRPDPPSCTVCQRIPGREEAVLHLVPVTIVQRGHKGPHADETPNACHDEIIYCSACAWIALYPPPVLVQLIKQHADRAWAHPGPHPQLECCPSG